MFSSNVSKCFLIAAALFAKSAAAQDQTVTVPAGTKVVLVLKSGLHSTSAVVGSGLYLETLFPVVQDNRVVIPVRTQVQGVVVSSDMPGRIKRGAELMFRFTTMIFPDNTVVPIEGTLFGIPGAKNVRVRNDEGKLQTIDQTGKAVTPVLMSAMGVALAGASLGGGEAALRGAGVGAGIAVIGASGKRGDDIDLPRGTNVEMALAVPLVLTAIVAERNARYVAPPVLESANARVNRTPVERQENQTNRTRKTLGLMLPMWLLLGIGHAR